MARKTHIQFETGADTVRFRAYVVDADSDRPAEQIEDVDRAIARARELGHDRDVTALERLQAGQKP